MDSEIMNIFRKYVNDNQEILNVKKEQKIDTTEDQKMFNQKVSHSGRVAQLCKEIAQNERFNNPIKGMEKFMIFNSREGVYQLSSEAVNLATIIGLYHDIGRFSQIVKYHTLNDADSVDHGKLGYDLLVFTKMVENALKPQDYLILYEAIYNHNQYTINKALDPSTKYFCALVRDADKIDIVREMVEGKLPINSQPQCPLSKNVIDDILIYGHLVQNEHIRTVNDYLARIFSFRFDINTKYAKKMIVDEELFLKLYKKIEHKKDFDIIFNLSNEKREGSNHAR